MQTELRSAVSWSKRIARTYRERQDGVSLCELACMRDSKEIRDHGSRRMHAAVMFSVKEETAVGNIVRWRPEGRSRGITRKQAKDLL